MADEIVTGTDPVAYGNGAQTIIGDAANNTIDAGNGPDTITGNGGDDTLTGGNGPDTFVYNFTSLSFNLNFFDDGTAFDPSLKANINAWSNAEQSWLSSVIAQYGADAVTSNVDTTDTMLVGNKNTATLNNLDVTVNAGFTSTDGHDTITDFHVGTDHLQLSGISATDFATYFHVVSDGQGGTTVELGNGSVWSVDLAGVSVSDLGATLTDAYHTLTGA